MERLKRFYLNLLDNLTAFCYLCPEMTSRIADKQAINSASETKVPKQLKAHTFKKGQSGNPKGRPKSILSKRERLELLSQYAKLNPDKVNPIAAIREHNLMDHIYDEKPQYQDNRVVNIIVQDKETKEKLVKMLEGAKHGQLAEPEEKDE